MPQRKTWISLLILVILGLHALPVVSYQAQAQTRWPFLAWAMYAKSYPPGPIQVAQRRVLGTTSSGSELEITPVLAGLTKPAFRNTYLVPLARHDSAAAQRLLNRLNRGSDSIVTIRLEELTLTLTDSGVVRRDHPIVTYHAPRNEALTQ
ncbi:MAG: hypothetical protein H0T50_12135 [Gemmatimonadales bacterium]|nr:hypothetical protein [Gemmatimonadales bacterium]